MQGDVKQGHQVKANGAYLEIRPLDNGSVWRVRGIYFTQAGVADDIQVVRTDTTNEIVLESSVPDCTGFVGMTWFVSYAFPIRIKNRSGVNQTLGYDAIEIIAGA